MERCLALALSAVDRGEYPYAAVVAQAGRFVCEATSSVNVDHNVTHHAELMAIASAFKALGRTSLDDCTIYSNAEPCALCSYAIRESRIGRVVYGIPAPVTGGHSRWNILADSACPTIFRKYLHNPRKSLLASCAMGSKPLSLDAFPWPGHLFRPARFSAVHFRGSYWLRPWRALTEHASASCRFCAIISSTTSVANDADIVRRRS